MSEPPTNEADHSSDSSPTTPEDLGFAGCLSELDSIVRGLETDSIDVDHLSASVERAAELVEWCRGCLGDTRTRLDEVLPRLELAHNAEDVDSESALHGESGEPGEGSEGEHG